MIQAKLTMSSQTSIYSLIQLVPALEIGVYFGEKLSAAAIRAASFESFPANLIFAPCFIT